jgi:predicted alpha/beta hydrolase family esterase
VKQGKKEIICKTSIPNTFANRNLKKFAHEVERVTQIACKTKEEGMVAALESMMTRKDQNEMLRQLKVPKVSIIGKEDNFIPYETALGIAERTGMETCILETSGHMGFIEQRQESLKEVFRLLYEC